MDQRAYYRAHLVLQERARRRGDAHVVAVARDVETVEGLYRRFRLAFGGTERREIVLADEILRGSLHRGAIERARHAPGAVLLERKIGAAVADAIEVMPLGRRETRVESFRDPFRHKHRDRPRAQMEIDGVAHIVAVPVPG